MRILYLISFAILFSISNYAQNALPSFKVVPLGVKGGLDESNLSAYMVAPAQSGNYVCLDAGTSYAGIKKAISHHVFNNTATGILRANIKAYLISHAHLDHVAGVIINSPAATNKNIYGTAFCLNNIKNHYLQL